MMRMLLLESKLLRLQTTTLRMARTKAFSIWQWSNPASSFLTLWQSWRSINSKRAKLVRQTSNTRTETCRMQQDRHYQLHRSAWWWLMSSKRSSMDLKTNQIWIKFKTNNLSRLRLSNKKTIWCHLKLLLPPMPKMRLTTAWTWISRTFSSNNITHLLTNRCRIWADLNLRLRLRLKLNQSWTSRFQWPRTRLSFRTKFSSSNTSSKTNQTVNRCLSKPLRMIRSNWLLSRWCQSNKLIKFSSLSRKNKTTLISLNKTTKSLTKPSNSKWWLTIN